MNDAEINALVTRLARPHASGGVVIERAAILAEGADFPAIMAWIIAHAGKPETILSSAPRRGLHGARLNDSRGTQTRPPTRFVLPAGALAGTAMADSHPSGHRTYLEDDPRDRQPP